MRVALVFVLLVINVGLSRASEDIPHAVEADVAPRMKAEHVETLVRSLAAPAASDNRPKVSIRCTRANRLGAFLNEKGEIDTRTVWVAEVQGEGGADGAFYVLDDETGAVLAHGVVAGGSREGEGPR